MATPIGTLTIVRENGAIVARIKPSDRMAVVVVSILMLVLVLTPIVSPRRPVPPLVGIAIGVIAAFVYVWQFFGLTRLEVNAERIEVSKSVFGWIFSTRAVLLSAVSFVRLDERVARGKGGTMVSYFVTFGADAGPTIAIPVDRADGEVLVAMLDQARGA